MSETHHISIDGFEYTVVGSYTAGDPGQTSGPPENCWEGYSSEFEIESAHIALGERRVDLFSLPEVMTDRILQVLTESCREREEEIGCEYEPVYSED